MFRVIHEIDDYIAVYHDDKHLFTYVYNSKAPAMEAPRPYLHPIKTLAGAVVTGFRPRDHRWHHGLSLAFSHINGHNFWGGPTYVDGQDYVLLDNIGRQVMDTKNHRQPSVTAEFDELSIRTRLKWRTNTGIQALYENREIGLREINQDEGWYRIGIVSEIHNDSEEQIEIGSPTTQGRPKAGYGGLTWRGARDMTGGKILMSDGREAIGDESTVMGERSPWIAYTSAHDGTDQSSTVIFIDHSINPSYPTQWYVRAKEFAAVSASFMFDQAYIMEAHEILWLYYDVIIANGDWSGARIQELVDRLPK